MKRHWLRLGGRIARLLLSQPPQATADCVTASYDHLAAGYDDAWTGHMRDLSLAMLDKLAPPPVGRCLDLTCGTGFVTSELAKHTRREVIGVDASAGMLDIAQNKHGKRARFVQADALEFLRRQPPASFDAVTCGWGMGYSRPMAMLAGMARVLRSGGRWGIIDNATFSLAGVMWASLKTFAERPASLTRAMNVRFLPHSLALAAMARLTGLGVQRRWDGRKSYVCPTGRAALEKLTATGAAAGFEFAACATDREEIFERFAQQLDATNDDNENKKITVTHRYLAAVGTKTTLS